MSATNVVLLFTITSIIEILGCWLVLRWWTWLSPAWWALPAAAVSLAGFAWLLTLHAHAPGRVYAAYGGIYVVVSILWLMTVDRTAATRYDALGALLCIAGTCLIYFQPSNS